MKPIWDLETLRSMHREYLAGTYPSALAKRRKRTSGELLAAFRKHGLRILPKKRPVMPLRVSNELIAAMHADYVAGMTFAEVERKYGRSKSTARDIFIHRWLPVREPMKNAWRKHRADGTWEAMPPKTREEIDALIRNARTIAIPDELRLEWRKWDLARRADFIRRVRARLASPLDVPALPFSDNLTYFDYGSEAAWEIIRRANEGLTSRKSVMAIKLISEGVIWNGKLWFWVRRESYYMEGVPWRPDRPRRVLARVIYESVHGPLPHHSVVRVIDGNPNNLDPSNLRLATRDDICRENQANALLRKSRERTKALLNAHHQPTTSHAIARQISLA